MGAKIKSAIGHVIGTILIVLVVIWWWGSWLLGPFVVHRQPAPNERSAQEAIALDDYISCMHYRDWWITSTSGRCSDFKPPPKLAIGEHFFERGVKHEIRIILATHVERDNPEMKMKAGDWYCEAAEHESDLDHWKGKQWQRTWLFIAKCQPTR